jgi:hypothetical protein
LNRNAGIGRVGYHISLGEPRHVDVTGDCAYAVVPVSMAFELQGNQVTHASSVFKVALGQGRL